MATLSEDRIKQMFETNLGTRLTAGDVTSELGLKPQAVELILSQLVDKGFLIVADTDSFGTQFYRRKVL